MKFASRMLFLLLLILLILSSLILLLKLFSGDRVKSKHPVIRNDVDLEHLGVDMKFWDTRPKSCKSKNYNNINKSDRVSIIIVYFNEPLLTLLKLIISIFKHTRNELIEEILLIDDNSDEFYNFANYFTKHVISDKLKYKRNLKREGLIRSRNDGATMSRGKYLLFLDSHSEVGENFLEPLLGRVKIQPFAAVSPVLDILTNKGYKASSNYLKGGFDWMLRFKWIPMSEEEREKRKDPGQPFVSPTTIGGTFLVRKQWFHELGGFDNNMEIWGGESTEFSIKLWLCGGHIEVIPCSRVAHKFRDKHSFNYSTDIFIKNTKRIVESWFGDFKHIYYSNRPEARDLSIDMDSFKSKEEVKRRLNCRDFRWYLSNVFPSLLETQEYIAFGALKQGNKCLIVTKQKQFKLKDCPNYVDDANMWILKKDTEHLTFNDVDCIAATKTGESSLFIEKCSNDAGHQKWTRQGAKLYHRETHECLEHIHENMLELSPCQPIISQFWHFTFELQTASSLI